MVLNRTTSWYIYDGLGLTAARNRIPLGKDFRFHEKPGNRIRSLRCNAGTRIRWFGLSGGRARKCFRVALPA
jgi:hypothetical protein